MSTKLPTAVQKAAGIGNGMRTATVVAVSSTAVTISVSGGQFSSGVGVVTSYAPKVGDTVAVFRQDSSWLILGPTSTVNGWQSMAALGYQGGWSDRGSPFPIGQYRQLSWGVQLTGELTIASTPTGTVVSGLPPATGETVMVAAMGPTGTFCRLTMDANGALKIFNGTAGTLQMCCWYPTDSRLS